MNTLGPLRSSENQQRPTGGFRPLSLSQPADLLRERPGNAEPYIEFTDRDGFACFVRTSAVKEMSEYGHASGERETIGHLGGRRCRDHTGPYILAEKATLVHGARGSPGSIVADIGSQQAAKRDFDRRCRPLDAVGWWHTHLPGVGLFFSGTDRQNQATWNGPDSIGIVLHPGLEGEGLKVFRGAGAVELTRKMGDDSLIALRREDLIHSEETSTDPTAQPLGGSGQRLPQQIIRIPGACRRTTIAMCIAIAAIITAIATSVFVWISWPRLSASQGREAPPAADSAAGDMTMGVRNGVPGASVKYGNLIPGAGQAPPSGIQYRATQRPQILASPVGEDGSLPGPGPLSAVQSKQDSTRPELLLHSQRGP